MRKLLLLLGMFITPLTNAAQLGSGSIDIGFSTSQTPLLWGTTPVSTSVNVTFSGSTVWAVLVSDMFTVDSLGNTQSYSSGATFDALVTLLTNGQNDVLSWNVQNYAGGVSTGVLESYYLAGSPHLLNGIDFAGSSIDHIDLSITNLSTSPGSNPNGDGVWTDWKFNIAMNVYGTPPVPEPEVYAMLLAGLGFVGAMSRRRKQLPTH